MNLFLVFLYFKERSRQKIVIKQGELNMRGFTQKLILPIFVTFSVATLSSCGGGGEEGADSSNVVIEGDKPIAYVERNSNTTGNPTDAATCSAGGKLYIRKLSSASSNKTDVTTHLTGGQGDVSDLEVSYDGTKILFAMKLKCNSGTWNIYEYDSTKGLSSSNPSRVITDDAEAAKGNDIDPTYYPRDTGDLIVFSSNRQTRSRELMDLNNIEPYAYRDEYERERVSILHTMSESGENIRQISYNQSHDRNPAVLSTGEIVFSRWDHLGGINEFRIFTTNPDGTNMFVFYGAHSSGNSFLHPRPMPDNKTLISSLMPLSRTREGGALVMIKANDCSEQGECNEGVSNAQSQATSQPMNFGRGLSQFGRATDPYPLFDGTNRALISWAASCSAIDVTKCPTELNLATNTEEATENTPQYGVYMLNLSTKDLDIIDIGTTGKVLRSPVALIARPKPNGLADKPVAAPALVAGKDSKGILNVKSVYDTDSQSNSGRMGNGVLMTGENIPLFDHDGDDSAPNSTPHVANIDLMKNPSNSTNYKGRPARFIRVIKAVPTPPGMGQDDMGETMFEMQQIIGYSEIEPDGSFKIEVPADTPIALSALDSEGRAFQIHTNWIQVRPGEVRTCNGCHSSRRGSALNVSEFVQVDHAGRSGDETMAETRFNTDPTYKVTPNVTTIEHTDFWASGTERTADITINYTGAPVEPQNGVINYPEHIQPIWDAIRTNSTGADIVAGDETIIAGNPYSCTSCHNVSTEDSPATATNPTGTTDEFKRTAGLDLSGTPGGKGYLTSYSELMVGDPILDADGLPTITIDADGDIKIARETAAVRVGLARASFLVAVLYGDDLRAGKRQVTLETTDPVSGQPVYELGDALTPIENMTPDHSVMLNKAEHRIINEWIDLGGQYYNTAFNGDTDGDGRLEQSELRTPPRSLSESTFAANVHPILLRDCAGCHQAFGGNGATGEQNSEFSRNRFVLTGNEEGDFNITTTMVSDTTTPANNALLNMASSTNPAIHPQVNGATGGAILPVSSTAGDPYKIISDWITSTP